MTEGIADLSEVLPLRSSRAGTTSRWPALLALALSLSLFPSLFPNSRLEAQETGTIIGRVVDASTGEPLQGVQIELLSYQKGTLSSEEGRFILVAVPPGQRTIRVTLIGYTRVTREVLVRTGRPSLVDIEMRTEAIELEGVTAEVDRAPLLEPEISATHEVVLGSELREMPVDAIAEAVELAPGVTDGHFRGGRIGQETYVVDGLEFKNQLEASSEGAGLELPPSSLEEIEVVTGGLGAQYGNALSGVVRYTTRRGNPDGWEGQLGLRTDHWMPESHFIGFNALSANAGGPLDFLGDGTTIFTDILVQGMADAEPRARGLTCLEPGDGDPALDAYIQQIRNDADRGQLYCPFSSASFPHQRGDKLLGFVRIDRPLGPTFNLTASWLTNRVQQQLYTSEFKYNSDYQLGQRTTGNLAALSVDWVRQGVTSGFHLTGRIAVSRLDRYLGAVDVDRFEDRARPLGFGLSSMEFLGEDFARADIDAQLASAAPIPGYLEPGGATGSPFGPAAEGIFFTEGTPEVANWSRSEFFAADLVGEYLTADRHTFRGGFSTKLFRIENYERVLAYLPGSSPNYTRFFPRTVSGFAEISLAAADEFNFSIGGRMEAFQAGLRFSEDRANFLAPELDTEWQTAFMPRIGFTGPIPGTEEKTAFRFNFGQVTQPPDFQFFLDTSIGDSLRTDIRRQGNPNLSFERGSSYELGLSQLVGENMGFSMVGFRKELTNLVTGALQFQGFADNQFTTGDFGTVTGLELSLRGRWERFSFRAGYALQEAKGVVSNAFEDPDEIDRGENERTEFPLSFDRRHAVSLALYGGRAAGDAFSSWGASFVGNLRSGTPLYRLPTEPDPTPNAADNDIERLPWQIETNLRVTKELGIPVCGSCTWRVMADVRNLFFREDVRALRRDTGTVAPNVALIDGRVTDGPFEEAIPRESPRYSAAIDFNRDGTIDAGEYFGAREAAALDRFDPSLFFGEAFEFRLGVEVSFR